MEWTKEREAHLAFLQHPGIGSRRLRTLKATFGTLERAWLASTTAWRQAGLPDKEVSALSLLRKAQRVHQAHTLLEQDAITLLLPTDPEYPPLLHRLSDRPEALFVRGTIRTMPWIAFVGSRNMTSYGERCIQELIPPLVAAGCGIVSGLALGIDGAAHRAALKTRGYTAAFLGGSVDESGIYPREHLKLAHEILEHGGALFSEFPPGTPSMPFLFPLRNRLIAGSTLATVVVEAALNSGSLITAKSALEENREVLALPGPIWSKTSAGCNRLIQAGAHLCTSASDILELLQIDRPQVMAEAQTRLPLDAFEKTLLEILSEPLSIDHIARKLKEPSPKISSSLSLLELKGLVQNLDGQNWLAKGSRND